MRLRVFFSFLFVSSLLGAIDDVKLSKFSEVTVRLDEVSLKALKASNDNNLLKTFKGLLGGMTMFDEQLQNLIAKNSQVLVENLISKGSKVFVKDFMGEGSKVLVEDFMARGSKVLVEDLMGEGFKVFVEAFEKTGDIVTKNYKKTALYTTLGIVVVIGTWHGGKVLANHINRKLQKPKVIISSSHENWFQWFKRLVVGEKKKQPVIMVFPRELEKRLNRMINVTKHISKHIQKGKKGVKYRNILLYGPPGTGKTMFARKLAHESGMEFAELTGSSLFQKGAGITAIDELFAWAKKSKKGLCLFVDEADSLFTKRGILHPDSESYRMVNHFLNYLGERSDKFMVIMATNHHMGFDEAMHRRIDDAIEMPLPGNQERYAVLQHYRQTILHDKESGQAFDKSVQQYLADKKLKEIAHKTEGFSYGDMHGIINKLKTDAFTTKDGLLNPQLIDEVVKEYQEKREAFTPKPPLAGQG